MTSHRVDCGGKTLLELLWDQLMETYAELMQKQAEVEAPMPPSDWEDQMELSRLRGVAKGLAQAIALIVNPYAPDLDAVRQEALERYENREA